MEYPVIDVRTEEALVKEIGRKAKSYTPEWRFDRTDPDPGTALALMFAKLHHRTIGQFNKLLYKDKIDLFDRIGASMRPCAPAEGVVAFSLVNGVVGGTHLEKGVALTSDKDRGNGEKVGAETLDDVYVTPARIQAIYESRKDPERINRLYESEGEQSMTESLLLFGGGGEALAEHEWSFSHPSMFAFEKTGRLGLIFSGPGQAPFPEELLQRLADPACAVFSYSAEEGFVSFAAQYVKEGILYLEKKASQPPVSPLQIQEVSQYWVKMTLLDHTLCDRIQLCGLRLLSEGPSMIPDYVQAEGTEQAKELCIPFGERFSIYNEVYFASREALSKRGALIRFSFLEGFIKVPVQEQEKQPIQWKLVMPRSAVSVSKEYDITIGEVVWEYFNGLGWARLFPGQEYSDVFSPGDGTDRKRHTLVFRCPEDMAPAYVGAAQAYHIRARILKVANAFKTEGQYISPVLSQISFRYDYPLPGCRPGYFFCRSILEERSVRAETCFQGTYPWKPFWQSEDRQTAVYVGLDRPLTQGPIRMLWVLKDADLHTKPVLAWEYVGNGGRFKSLDVEDGTEGLRQTGIVTFEGCGDWQSKVLFGQDLYWLRIRDVGDGYEKEKALLRPVVEAVYMNAARIRATRSGYRETFTVSRYEEHLTFQLLHSDIYRLELWIDETATISRQEEERLEKEGRLQKKQDFSGMVTEVWVRWEQKASFSVSEPDDRHYILDANEGTITFGDGRHGRVPAVGVVDGIRVSYSTGGGKETDLAPGEITGLELSAGFINQATNPMHLTGGYDREDVEDAIRRRAGELRHRFRAVTLMDYEMLAMEAARGIARVRCVSGYDEEGRPAPGSVSLLVLPEDHQKGGHFFPELKKKIYRYLEDKADPDLIGQERLHILQPTLVKVGVQCKIMIKAHDQSYEIRSMLIRRLEQFLDPLTGGVGGKGWQIGQLPDRSQIVEIIYQDERIRHMEDLLISCTVRSDRQEKEVSQEDLGHDPYLLTVNGTHRVTVRVG